VFSCTRGDSTRIYSLVGTWDKIINKYKIFHLFFACMQLDLVRDLVVVEKNRLHLYSL
jgi:hypothetical protein